MNVRVNRQGGFNLLECLLVLVVIAIVSLIGIHRYRAYQQNIQMASIKNDIAAIQSALNRYYHTVGCEVSGMFPDNKRRPGLATLGLYLPGRPPQIPLGGAYSVKIIQRETQDKKPAYLYVLQVAANFAPTYSQKQMEWFQKKFGAHSVSRHQLIWITLPSNSAFARGEKLWVMQSYGEQFRRSENAQLQKLGGSAPDRSPSYCSH